MKIHRKTRKLPRVGLILRYQWFNGEPEYWLITGHKGKEHLILRCIIGDSVGEENLSYCWDYTEFTYDSIDIVESELLKLLYA